MVVPPDFLHVTDLQHICIVAAKKSILLERLRKGDFGQEASSWFESHEYQTLKPHPDFYSLKTVYNSETDERREWVENTTSPEKMHPGSKIGEIGATVPAHENVKQVENHLAQFLLESFLCDNATEVFASLNGSPPHRLSKNAFSLTINGDEFDFDISFNDPRVASNQLYNVNASRADRFAFIDSIRWKIRPEKDYTRQEPILLCDWQLDELPTYSNFAGADLCIKLGDKPTPLALLKYTKSPDKEPLGGRPNKQITDCKIAIRELFPNGKGDSNLKSVHRAILQYLKADPDLVNTVGETTMKKAFIEVDAEKSSQKP